ncbi:septal ring lytic transglycosylase RlpA family protein [Hymenobacter sp. BT664]|uniref:Probable endolytic peptidoglycan transglycosylase RlpA n=1 Tax=Hymenobacter montanus TaxID=2771359 RepID=A0A927BF74_9BACT|nr:septal ring lytic transglycosylase RlpA family protein [Hymenobacter montanus]MBD2769306.1 septal ring lytic transglycosylase RlpA family protein [Hymenobacter montanus]
MKIIGNVNILFNPLFSLLLASVLLASCHTPREVRRNSRDSPRAYTQKGLGSYYADKFAGRPTASGAIYRPGQMTAAHNTLPFGTLIRVTNTRNGRSVEVTVTDRGPHTKGYIVDVSRRAATQLDIIGAGAVPVQLTVIRASAP